MLSETTEASEKLSVSKTKDETPTPPTQLAIENTQNETSTQTAEKNTQNQSSSSVASNTPLENTFRNMTETSNFFNTVENQEHSWFWIRKPIWRVGGTIVHTKEKEIDFIDNI